MTMEFNVLDCRVSNTLWHFGQCSTKRRFKKRITSLTNPIPSIPMLILRIIQDHFEFTIGIIHF